MTVAFKDESFANELVHNLAFMYCGGVDLGRNLGAGHDVTWIFL